MTKVLQVYGAFRSQPTRAVLWLLHLKAHPYKLIPTLPASRQPNGSRHPSFLSKFPTGVIPTIEDVDGYCLAESNAILTYLCTKYGWNNLYPYKDLSKQAKVDELLHWHHTNTRALTIGLLPLLNHKLAQGIPKDYLDVQAKVGLRALKQLEKRLELNQTRFLCGPDLSIGDMCVYGDVGQISPRFKMEKHVERIFGPSALDFEKLPRVRSWMEEMEQVPEYDVIHQEFGSFVSKL